MMGGHSSGGAESSDASDPSPSASASFTSAAEKDVSPPLLLRPTDEGMEKESEGRPRVKER